MFMHRSSHSHISSHVDVNSTDNSADQKSPAEYPMPVTDVFIVLQHSRGVVLPRRREKVMFGTYARQQKRAISQLHAKSHNIIVSFILPCDYPDRYLILLRN